MDKEVFAVVLVLTFVLVPATMNYSYCAGTQSINSSLLYAEPPCDISNQLMPPFNTSISYSSYAVQGLSFCCKANYTAVLPAGANLTALDAEAAFLYSLVDMFLLRYDCANFYPFYTCNVCRDAYRTWICAMLFPMKCFGTDTSAEFALRICDDVCLEVQRKCPSEMGFICPMYSLDGNQGKYGPWGGGDNINLFGGGGCNPMHYNLGPGSQYGGSSCSRSTTMIFVLVMLLSLFFS